LNLAARQASDLAYFALGGHLQCVDARLDLRLVEPMSRGVEEGEHAADPRLLLDLRLMEHETQMLLRAMPSAPARTPLPGPVLSVQRPGAKLERWAL